MLKERESTYQFLLNFFIHKVFYSVQEREAIRVCELSRCKILIFCMKWKCPKEKKKKKTVIFA